MKFKNKRKPGRPKESKAVWTDSIPSRAYELCLLGLKDAELAVAFGVSIYTIDKWKQTHPEFREAILRGKEQADAKVAEALYHKALGYSHKAVDIRIVEGEIVKVPYTKIYPPDTTACIFWLKNRQRQAWTDVKRHDHTGTIGVAHSVTRRLDLSDFSEEELALAEKLAGKMLPEGDIEDAEYEEGEY